VREAVQKDQLAHNRKEQRVANRKIFVGGIPQNASKTKLKQYFEVYGKVEEVVIMFRREKKGLGFAFVTFEQPSSVHEVIADYDHHQYENQFVRSPLTLDRLQNSKNEGRD
jgi:RNA-binding protein Musashi